MLTFELNSIRWAMFFSNQCGPFLGTHAHAFTRNCTPNNNAKSVTAHKNRCWNNWTELNFVSHLSLSLSSKERRRARKKTKQQQIFLICQGACHRLSLFLPKKNYHHLANKWYNHMELFLFWRLSFLLLPLLLQTTTACWMCQKQQVLLRFL